MNLSFEYVQFLRDKILEYLPSSFKPTGNGTYNGRCPFCGDSRKSATKRRGFFYAGKDCSYYCFNCGAHMSGMQLLQALSGEDYADLKREYVKTYLRSGGAELPSSFSSSSLGPGEPGLFDLKPVVRPEWKKPLSDDARAYLAGRRVLEAPFLRDPLWSTWARGDEYILIPWTLNGVDAYYQLNDFKRAHSLKYVFPKSMRKLVYGLDNVDISWPYVIVFEGVYDSLFVKNGVAVGTKSVTDYQMRLIRERYPNHTVCLSFDNDAPGVASMTKAVERGDAHFFRWFGSGTAQKDVNDYVLATGDVRAFADRSRLERMIFGPLQMKMWIAQNWPAAKAQEKWKTSSAQRPKKRCALDAEAARRLILE